MRAAAGSATSSNDQRPGSSRSKSSNDQRPDVPEVQIAWIASLCASVRHGSSCAKETPGARRVEPHQGSRSDPSTRSSRALACCKRSPTRARTDDRRPGSTPGAHAG
jgi:hypothetical protein